MENTIVTELTNRQDCADAVQRLILIAEQHIAIFSQQLEPLLYNHNKICDAISQLARKNRHTSIRILALQTQSSAIDGHCLINLAQRLSSSIQIRVPETAELQGFSESWLIVDDHSICQINNPERYQGSLIENNRNHVKTQLDFFNLAWEDSLPDQNTRRLHL